MQEIDIGIREGDLLAGKYRVERVLGIGGMGVVVAAHHVHLDERVALKFLLPGALGNAEAVARFDQEARAAVKIKSEHVARVSDVGRLENGSPYMVMEYLDGIDLTTWLNQHGVLQVEQAVDFALQAGEAIAEAHALGIVHRDLKPANLFCIRRADGQLSIKVLDFGISKFTAHSSTASMAMTRTSSLVGSPNYMSPEQMQSSKGVDLRTDLWSMGVILFQLVTGQLPFDAGSVTELAIRIVTTPTPLPSGLRSDLPRGFEQAILKCLEKNREQRYQNVAELAHAIAPFGSKRARASVERIVGTLRSAGHEVGSGMSSFPPAGAQPGSVAAAAVSTVAGTVSSGGDGPRRASFGVAVAAGVGGAVVVMGVLVLVLTRAPASNPVSVASPPPPSEATSEPSSEQHSEPDPPSRTVAAPPSTRTPDLSPTPATAPSSRSSPRSVTSATHAPTHSPPSAAPKSQCDPPYYFDAQGNRVFKKACL